MQLGECWVETLTDSARQLRRTYLAHPAAASLSSYRTTQGPAEMKAVDIIISCVLAAGFEGAEAAVVYRAIGDFGLYWSGAEASFLAMDEQLQKNDRNAWTTAYLTADQAKYPAIWQVREHLPAVDDDEIFEMSLSLMLAGLLRPRPPPVHLPQARHHGTKIKSVISNGPLVPATIHPLTNSTDPHPAAHLRRQPPAHPVGYASDRNPNLSATPATPIGRVDGVGDRTSDLSMA